MQTANFTSLHFTAEETRPAQRKADPKVQQVYDPGKEGTCRPRHAKRNEADPDAPRRRTGTRHQGKMTRQGRVKQDSNGAPEVLDARDWNKRAGGEQQAETGEQARTQKNATIWMHHYEQPSQRGQAMQNKLYGIGPSAAARFVTEKFCAALPESVHTCTSQHCKRKPQDIV